MHWMNWLSCYAFMYKLGGSRMYEGEKEGGWDIMLDKDWGYVTVAITIEGGWEMFEGLSK